MSPPLERDPVSMTPPQWGVALFALLVLGAVWLFMAYQLKDNREQVEARQTATLANLSFIVAENLGQLLDRARTLRMLVCDVREGHISGGDAGIAALILSDPVFTRLSLYDARGALNYSSSAGAPEQLDAAWRVAPDQDTADIRVLPSAAWQQQDSLPLLLPDQSGGESSFLLLELDLGYFLKLYQKLDFGAQASIQLLSASGQTLAQVDAGGLVVEGGDLDNSLITNSRLQSGRFINRGEAGGATLVGYFQRLESFPFAVVIRQLESDLLAHHQAQRSRYILTVLLLSGVVLAGVAWLLRTMHGRDAHLWALERSEQRNLALLERLQKEHRQTLEAASRDALTGLYNRRLFMELAYSHLLGAKRQGRFAAVLFIDLDRFKAINDSLGHKVGDLLLQAVAGRLNSCLRESDIVSRFGGDEFVVMLTGVKRRDDIAPRVQQLVDILAAPYAELEGSGLSTSPSIGIALSPQDGMDIETLVKHADMAMYTAKRGGRGRYALFDTAPSARDLNTVGLAEQLPSAITRQLEIHLQPRLLLPDYRLAGFEALVRWEHPDFGLLPPAQLLPLAEAQGLMAEVTCQVIRKVCEQWQLWRQEGTTVVPVAVNLGLSQLQDADLPQRIIGLLDDYGVEYAWLELDVNEADLKQLQPEQLDQLRALRQLGIGLNIDDFGSCGLSPEQLRRLPFNRIKLAQSFIRDIYNSYDDNVLLSATISLAQRLGLKVTAKCLETPDQLVYLKLAGCDEVQGHLLSRALSASEVRTYRRQTEPVSGVSGGML
ncbi:putative bifunctional diguanylate cyclase/phosphodiesterase [Marinobacterium marinum]|uniref:EAL domain-containing protein n=1 Tax=Marinobacterium marinum TaxID=2756129 RepID=A0A7W1WYL5_9GAMM|nr:EAL domain-containing protein [Marinobacterium marinum]MBA4502653.1 EAL domain-containing protein [Marinobacterium marinum]